MIESKIKSNRPEEDLVRRQTPLKMNRILLYIAGVLSLTLGIIGIVVPVLPTTPFILLSATCFFKSSKKAYNWLLNNKVFGRFIRNYREGKGISRKHKTITIGILWFTIILSMLMIGIQWVKILLPIIAVLVSAHIILIKPQNKRKAKNQSE